MLVAIQVFTMPSAAVFAKESKYLLTWVGGPRASEQTATLKSLSASLLGTDYIVDSVPEIAMAQVTLEEP